MNPSTQTLNPSSKLTLTATPPDPVRLQQLAGQVISDLGAAANGALTLLGDRLGIYRALAAWGPATAQDLAAHTSLDERYLCEWLASQAASGYVTYDSGAETFRLTPEQAAVFADPDGPAAMTGGYWSVSSVYHDEPLLAEAFRTGEGIEWGRHQSCLFCGVERFYRAGYIASLTSEWLPALDGAVEKLAAGARVADVGCGHGASTILMAQAFPYSEFIGYDIHEKSVETARKHAAEQGAGNVRFEVASAQDFPGENYDLVTVFDALHDMGDPAAAAVRIRRALAPDGTWMLVEPMAGDTLAENLHPIGRVFYAFSTAVCVPTSKSQPTRLALGAQAGEKRLREVITAGGFTRIRRAAGTPVNLVLEARP